MFRNSYSQHNLYDILEVNPKASHAVIEAAYKALVKKYHPDLNAGISDHKIKLLNMAKEVLLDEHKRRDYDGTFNLHHAHAHKSANFESMSFMRGENERLKRENEDLQKKLAARSSAAPADENTVYVLCTSCGTRNRMPNMSFLNMQNIKCGMCKTPFGTGNRDFEKERDLKEKAAQAKRNADIEWRRISENISKVEYARIDNLLKKYQQIQEIYPRVYGLKTKLKSLKDELLIRNSNMAFIKKFVEGCSEELQKNESRGIFGLFKNSGPVAQIKERLSREMLMYPRIADEKIVYNCRECAVKNAVKVEMFISNHENILCGSCHGNLFK